MAIPDPQNGTLDLTEKFTIQMWVKTANGGNLFNKGNDYSLSYNGSTVRFEVGGQSVSLPFQSNADTFFHVTATYEKGKSLKLYTQVRTGPTAVLDSAIAAAPTSVLGSAVNLRLGGNNFVGNIDEVRLWKRVLDSAEIVQDFSRYIGGTEDSLVGYWRANEGIGKGVYDLSVKDDVFNENHGTIVGNITWDTERPLNSQLAYKGITNADGFYTVAGFPYLAQGTPYTFTPIFGVHEFEPNRQTRFAVTGNNVFNEVDFTDISSFRVTGTVYYRHSFFPVEGVEVLIDGAVVTTDREGKFEIDVPIGRHYIRLKKFGHNFELDGRFPAITEEDSSGVFDFQEPLIGIEFIDNTLVKLAGRVVGGTREGNKPLGFGLSKDNIGDATLFLTTEKGFDLTQSDSTVTYTDDKHINAKAEFITTRVTLSPDTETGEYVAYLPPEKFIITEVTAGDYTFDGSYTGSLNLEQSFEQENIYEDTVFASVNGEAVPGFPPLNADKYDRTYEVNVLDTVYTVGVDSFRYEVKKDFVLRVRPSIDAVTPTNSPLFGEKTYDYKDDFQETEIKLIENDAYTFGHPVFVTGKPYRMKVSVFEEYINSETGENDRVPVSDGRIDVVNDFSNQRGVTTSVDLNEKGEAIYEFTAGLPNFNRDVLNPENSFTNAMSLAAITGESQNIRTLWRADNPFRAYLFGGRMSGNSFTTSGPNQVITILRDPPGSNSQAYLEQGSTIETSTTWGNEVSTEQSVAANFDFGGEVTTYSGSPVAGTIQTTETVANLSVGLTVDAAINFGGEQTMSITTTEVFTTSDDAAFVGAAGDVFIGYGTNIVFGSATQLQPLPVASKECEAGDCGEVTANGFSLGKRATLNMSPQFATSFIYTQYQIETEIIPGLQEVRNNFLQYNENPDAVAATDEIIYLSLVPPTDERFGTSNYDKKVWGDQASAELGNGPSYKILIPEDASFTSDTIAYFNEQVRSWEFWLKENEKQKVEATLDKNISVDGGATFESSVTTTQSETSEFSFAVGVTAEIATEVGFEVFGIGTTVETSSSFGYNREQGNATTEETETTYGYVIADGEGAPSLGGTVSDFHSIDVKKPSDGFGPVFLLRAGATSCPYEGEQLTKYFDPGNQILQNATEQVEAPELTILNPLVTDVPTGGEAEIILQLKNNSESGVPIVYSLAMDDLSNPNGAVLSIDGSTLSGTGREFLVPPGTGITKVLKVAKGRNDVDDYEDIGLTFSSTCDGSIGESQTFSVYFQPGCTNVALNSPADKWVINTNTAPANTMKVEFGGYDLQNEQFEYALFQYKGSATSLWITGMQFYNPKKYTEADFANLDNPKAWLNEEGVTTYLWDMGDLPDRNYDVRVVTVCEIAPGEFTRTISPVHSGVKDTRRPGLFGAAQPADGILSSNDEIKLVFDEFIEDAFINLSNFTVQGVLNGYELRHDASISFDGSTNYARIPDGLNLGGSAYTIEWWQQRNAASLGKRQVVFSKGTEDGNKLEIGFTESDKLFVNVGGQEIESLLSYTSDEWQHFAIVYNPATELIDAYMNDQYAIERAPVTGNFNGEGGILLGKSIITDDQHFRGNLHELRIWDQAKTLGDVFAEMLRAQTGTEIGLIGYWQFDEAFGNQGLDKARFRHAALFTSWLVLPKGVGYAFDGQDDYLEFFAGNTVIITDEMDFTLEFWFKAAEGQNNVTMFSSGKGDGSDQFNVGNWRIGFNENGHLQVLSNGAEIVLDSPEDRFLDDDWYHLAVAVKRRGNVQVYINGELRAQQNSTGFGGLTGANMWLGARGFKEGTVTTNHDEFFNGQLDEFRIWGLNRTQEQLVLYRNAKVSTTEPGLIAYYPFEEFNVRQGVTFTDPTLFDQWENPFGSNGGEMTAFGGGDYSPETPNLKQSRPVSKVDFDWAVFENQLIITPSSGMFEAIEQTVLEITVERIQDLYENRIASPISWTAFVDRNQLKWDQRSITIEKRVNEPTTFTVDILNKSGQQQQFSFSNLPPWLTASPAGGSVEPLTAQTITFIINEGLNTGSYQEDLFLIGNSGFDEKMVLNVRVFNELPGDWVYNPDDFQYSMNVVGIIKLNGRISTDTYDKLAAFAGEECRGIVNLRYIQQIDSYLAFLTVYSNALGDEQLIFKIWDDSEGIVYTDVEPALTFEQNQTFGLPLDPIVFEAVGQLQTEVVIPKGWKWVSFSLDSDDLTDLNELFDKVENNNGDLIKAVDSYAVYDEFAKWQGSLQAAGGIQNEQSYKVNFGEKQILRYSGSPLDLRNTPISVNQGWNWISYLPIQNLTIDEALASFAAENGDIIKSQYQFAIYTQDIGWLGSLTFMRPGDGYMLYTQGTNARTFTYPTISLLNGRASAVEEPVLEAGDYQIEPSLFEHNMSMLVQVGNGKQEGVLMAFIDNEVRGIAEPIDVENGEVRYFLTVFGKVEDEIQFGNGTKDLSELSFRYLLNGEEITLKANKAFNFKKNNVKGSVQAPVQLSVFGEETSPQAWTVYPNPFSQSVEIAFKVAEKEKVEVTVFNAAGKEMKQLWNGTLDAGTHQLTWEGSDQRGNTVAHGMYFIQIQMDNSTQTLKVVKY